MSCIQAGGGGSGWLGEQDPRPAAQAQERQLPPQGRRHHRYTRPQVGVCLLMYMFLFVCSMRTDMWFGLSHMWLCFGVNV